MSPSIYLSHLSRDYVVFEKSCIFTFTTPIPPLHVTCRSLDHMSFDQGHISISTRPENSVGNTKHRKTYKSKTLFDLYHMHPLKTSQVNSFCWTFVFFLDFRFCFCLLDFFTFLLDFHCVKSVQIRSYF